MKLGLLYLSFAALFPAVSPGPPDYKVEAIGPCTSAEISEGVRNALAPQGVRITSDNGILCEIWFRKVVPQKPGSAGTAYGTLAAGTFVGVINYPRTAGDYRGQGIKTGTYTLRYQTIPQDGNHLGVSPSPDFLLCGPAGADKDPDGVPEYQDLIKLGKQASGTNHPHPLLLIQPSGAGSATFRQSDDGHWAFEARFKAKPSGDGPEVDFPVAVILIGKAEG